MNIWSRLKKNLTENMSSDRDDILSSIGDNVSKKVQLIKKIRLKNQNISSFFISLGV